MTPILAIASLTVMQPAIVKALLSTPEGRLQALQSLNRKYEAGTKTYKEIRSFDERYKTHMQRAKAVTARVLALREIKDDEERRKAAEELMKEVRAVKKESEALLREWDEIARRAKERNKSK